MNYRELLFEVLKDEKFTRKYKVDESGKLIDLKMESVLKTIADEKEATRDERKPSTQKVTRQLNSTFKI